MALRAKESARPKMLVLRKRSGSPPRTGNARRVLESILNPGNCRRAARFAAELARRRGASLPRVSIPSRSAVGVRRRTTALGRGSRGSGRRLRRTPGRRVQFFAGVRGCLPERRGYHRNWPSGSLQFGGNLAL